MIGNHCSQHLGGGNAMGVIVAAGAPGEEVGAISYTFPSERFFRKTEQSVVRSPTAVALPIRTWNENRQDGTIGNTFDWWLSMAER
jgi:hypothetical protein